MPHTGYQGKQGIDDKEKRRISLRHFFKGLVKLS